MKHARLNVRWQGHALGDIVHGRDAEAAMRSGKAEEITLPKPRKIRTNPSPTHEEPKTEENPDGTEDPTEDRTGT